MSYFKRMLDDYKYSSVETLKLFKDKPFRMSVYTSLALTASYFYANNPSMENYRSHLATMTCDLAEVGDAIRNDDKSREIQRLLKHDTEGRLRRFTLGVCNFIWITDYPSYVDLYEAHCKEVEMTWSEWPKSIVDVGVLGHWLWSEDYLKDFDINPEEWDNAAKRATS